MPTSYRAVRRGSGWYPYFVDGDPRLPLGVHILLVPGFGIVFLNREAFPVLVGKREHAAFAPPCNVFLLDPAGRNVRPSQEAAFREPREEESPPFDHHGHVETRLVDRPHGVERPPPQSVRSRLPNDLGLGTDSELHLCPLLRNERPVEQPRFEVRLRFDAEFSAASAAGHHKDGWRQPF